MAEKVTIPAELREKLAGANGDAVPLCDDAGNVVGYYLSPTRMEAIRAERVAQYEAGGKLVSEAELDAAERAGGRHSMAEVFKLLEKKCCPYPNSEVGA
jgi:hypothetical protein